MPLWGPLRGRKTRSRRRLESRFPGPREGSQACRPNADNSGDAPGDFRVRYLKDNDMEIRSNSFDASRQPPLSADITRPIRDSIERGTPEPADAEDVRAQVARNKAELAARMEAAAKQLA